MCVTNLAPAARRFGQIEAQTGGGDHKLCGWTRAARGARQTGSVR